MKCTDYLILLINSHQMYVNTIICDCKRFYHCTSVTMVIIISNQLHNKLSESQKAVTLCIKILQIKIFIGLILRGNIFSICSIFILTKVGDTKYITYTCISQTRLYFKHCDIHCTCADIVDINYNNFQYQSKKCTVPFQTPFTRPEMTSCLHRSIMAIHNKAMYYHIKHVFHAQFMIRVREHILFVVLTMSLTSFRLMTG